MGKYMVNNLAKKNKNVSIYDIVPETLKSFQNQKNIRICSSVKDVLSDSNLTITMLPDNDIVLDMFLNESNGLIALSKDNNKYFVNTSTVEPWVVQKIDSVASKSNIHFIDSPVSGGIVGARDGTLTFMVGSQETLFPKIKDTLELMGKNVVYCGGMGSGQIAKLCNNMLLAILMIGTSECMNLGIKNGLNPKLLMNIINTSTGRNWTSEVYNPVPNLIKNVPSNNDYENGFLTRLMLKDLTLVQNIAADSKVAVPLGSLAYQLYRILDSKGYSNKDFSIIYKYLSESF